MKKRILLQKSFLILFILTISTNLSATIPNSYLFDNIKEWVGGTGNWDVPANWSPVGVP